jgi:hypothetical protein
MEIAGRERQQDLKPVSGDVGHVYLGKYIPVEIHVNRIRTPGVKTATKWYSPFPTCEAPPAFKFAPGCHD